MKFWIGLVLFLLSSSNYILAQQFTAQDGKVKFLSKAPLNEFTGVSEQLNGLVDLKENVLDFYVDLNTLKTGIALRDKHMRENYLETEKFPFAEFTGKLDRIPALSQEWTTVTATGNFKIHGISKPISVQGKLRQTPSGNLELSGSFTVRLSDYQIDIPKLVFYELAEEQAVSLNLQLKPKR